jgi:hypothetical protein
MGRNLFIRVSAETYDEKEVIRAWPVLYALVWPDEESGSPGKMVRNLLPAAQPGVLQLVDAFVEYVHFGNMSEVAHGALIQAAKTLEEKRAELDEALGNRNVQVASGLAAAIEDALDKAENAAQRLNA